MTPVHDRYDSAKAVIYRFNTPTGFCVATYKKFGTKGSFLDYRRYFYGDDADRSSRDVFNAEVTRAKR